MRRFSDISPPKWTHASLVAGDAPVLAWSPDIECPVSPGEDIRITDGLWITIDSVTAPKGNSGHIASYTIHDERGDKYLARTAGTTSSRNRKFSLDPEAPVVDEATVERYASESRLKDAERRQEMRHEQDPRKVERRIRDRIRSVMKGRTDLDQLAFLHRLEDFLVQEGVR